MDKIFQTVFVSLFLFLAFFSLASGHGLGQTLTKETDKYVIEIEYEALEITEEEPVEYAFRLIERQANTGAEFDSVSVRVLDRKENRGVFSVSVNAKDSISLGPRVYLRLPKGDYIFNLAFIKGEEELVKETFDLTVLAAERGSKDLIPVGAGFLGGVILTAAIAFYIKRSK